MVGCAANCLYCLVTGGDHSGPHIAYKNYAHYLRHKLDSENGVDHFYYFAPKTEPFQECTLRTGIAHGVLREFIQYFKKNPRSQSKVFIISKAGKDELCYKHNGDTILDLLKELSGKVTYDTSISVMPAQLYPVLEPKAVTNESRLQAARLCQEHGISARWALVQPIILPFTDEAMDQLLKKLKDAQIEVFKPEFLTVSIENLAWIAQLAGHFNKNMEKALYELYINPDNMNNMKHKARLAPNREFSRKTLMRLKEHADQHGLRMTLCHWVRSELNIAETEVPMITRENWHMKIGVCKPV